MTPSSVPTDAAVKDTQTEYQVALNSGVRLPNHPWLQELLLPNFIQGTLSDLLSFSTLRNPFLIPFFLELLSPPAVNSLSLLAFL
jgi:hypothetical protein